MAQQLLGAHIALTEVLSSSPTTHLVTYNHAWLQYSPLSSSGTRHTDGSQIHVSKMLSHKIKTNKTLKTLKYEYKNKITKKKIKIKRSFHWAPFCQPVADYGFAQEERGHRASTYLLFLQRYIWLLCETLWDTGSFLDLKSTVCVVTLCGWLVLIVSL